MSHSHSGFLLLDVSDCGLPVQRLTLGFQFCKGVVEGRELLIPCMQKIFEEDLVLFETTLLMGGGENGT